MTVYKFKYLTVKAYWTTGRWKSIEIKANDKYDCELKGIEILKLMGIYGDVGSFEIKETK